MSITGVENLDRSVEKANAWLADIDAGFGTSDRHLAYRVLRAWLHCLRDRLSVQVAAHFAAQLPELLRGVFFDGWNPSRVPQKYNRPAYVTRFAHEARIHDSDVVKAARMSLPWPGATCPPGWWWRPSSCCPPICGNCSSQPRARRPPPGGPLPGAGGER